jgi:hypothetical protein
VLAVVLVLEHRLDVSPHLLLALLPRPDVLLQVQLHLAQLLVVLVQLSQVSVGLGQRVFELTQPLVLLGLELADFQRRLTLHTVYLGF